RGRHRLPRRDVRARSPLWEHRDGAAVRVVARRAARAGAPLAEAPRSRVRRRARGSGRRGARHLPAVFRGVRVLERSGRAVRPGAAPRARDRRARTAPRCRSAGGGVLPGVPADGVRSGPPAEAARARRSARRGPRPVERAVRRRAPAHRAGPWQARRVLPVARVRVPARANGRDRRRGAVPRGVQPLCLVSRAKLRSAPVTAPLGALLDALITRALEEDLAGGDLSTDAVIGRDQRAVARAIAKAPLVLCGADVFARVFYTVDPGLRVERFVDDGERCAPGTPLLAVEGAARSILLGERTALNFLQRLCGIATLTRAYVDAIPAGTRLRITDTRKTTPGLRALERWAVRVGGAHNHRNDLGSAVLLKDNHIAAAGGVKRAIE